MTLSVPTSAVTTTVLSPAVTATSVATKLPSAVVAAAASPPAGELVSRSCAPATGVPSALFTAPVTWISVVPAGKVPLNSGSTTVRLRAAFCAATRPGDASNTRVAATVPA